MTSATIGNTRRLYKSRTNRMIDGVCGGVAEYFNLDPTLVRIVWVLVTLLGGSGFLLYIAAMIIMPVNHEPLPSTGEPASGIDIHPPPDKKRFWGIVLVLIGGFILLLNLGLIADFSWWSFSHRFVFPALLITIGAVLVLSYSRRSTIQSGDIPEGHTGGAAAPVPVVKELRKSKTDKKLFGVCGGLAKYFNIDSTFVRIIYILLVLASFGWALLLYIIMGIVIPEEKPVTTSV
jgi:phage shock protein C